MSRLSNPLAVYHHYQECIDDLEEKIEALRSEMDKIWEELTNEERATLSVDVICYSPCNHCMCKQEGLQCCKCLQSIGSAGA